MIRHPHRNAGRLAANPEASWEPEPTTAYRGETLAPNPTPDASYEYQNASGAYEHEQDDVHDEGELDDDEEGYEDEEGAEELEEREEEEEDIGEEEAEEGNASETSSAMYDADADPRGFARRQDELAGVMEMGEQEARAIRRGPPFGRDRKCQSYSPDTCALAGGRVELTLYCSFAVVDSRFQDSDQSSPRRNRLEIRYRPEPRWHSRKIYRTRTI